MRRVAWGRTHTILRKWGFISAASSRVPVPCSDPQPLNFEMWTRKRRTSKRGSDSLKCTSLRTHKAVLHDIRAVCMIPATVRFKSTRSRNLRQVCFRVGGGGRAGRCGGGRNGVVSEFCIGVPVGLGGGVIVSHVRLSVWGGGGVGGG